MAVKPKYKTLQLDEGSYWTEIPEWYSNKEKYAAENPLLIKAVIPGTIISVHVSEGQKLKKDDRMLILEAMKMQNRIICPDDDVYVKHINVEEGQRVPKNELMIELAYIDEKLSEEEASEDKTK